VNNPEYILVDELGTVVTAVKTALALSVLNYQYGYVNELKETLKDYDKTTTYAVQKFPLIYLVQPFTITRGNFRYFGKANSLEIFIINETVQDKKAVQRMTDNFKAVIYPIYRELIKQIAKSTVFMESSIGKIPHKTTDMYYWGDQQQEKMINDVFDCMYINGLNLTIKNNCP
jgi:hypothetical protein